MRKLPQVLCVLREEMTMSCTLPALPAGQRAQRTIKLKDD